MVADKELEERVEKGDLTREEADEIRTDVIEESTLGQSVSIMRQIEESVDSELSKQKDQLDDEQYKEVKFKIMNEVGKEHQVAGTGILVEIIRSAEEYFKQQVDAGVITDDQAKEMKYEVVEDTAKDEMRRIVNAAMDIRGRLIKTAVQCTKVAQAQFKMKGIIKKAEDKISSVKGKAKKAVDDAEKEINGK